MILVEGTLLVIMLRMRKRMYSRSMRQEKITTLSIARTKQIQ